MPALKPVPTIARLRDDLDRLFNRLLPGEFLGEMAPTLPSEATFVWTPALDFAETPEEYVVRMEVPGIHKENIDVKLTGDMLTISGHREMTREGKDETFLWKEREVGKFQRSLRLPAAVLEDKVEANYQDGLLTIRLPRKVASSGSKILVK